MAQRKSPQGHTNVYLEDAILDPSTELALIPIRGGATVETTRPLPTLLLCESEWIEIGIRMHWQMPALVTAYEGVLENVCAHRVTYRYWDFTPRELTDDFTESLEQAAEERAKALLIDGYSSGDLNYCDGEEEIRGWWEIETNGPA